MDKHSPWHWIKIGFFLGIGFMIPALLIDLIGSFAMIKGMSSFMDSTFENTIIEDTGSYMDNFDQSQDIAILSHREQPMDGQLLVLGTLANQGEKTINSVQLEVELLDDNKAMVYECSEYTSHKIKPGAKENFQVKCGCSTTKLPAYTSYTIRVTQANSY